MGKMKKPASGKLVPAKSDALAVPADLLTDVRGRIDEAREATARAVNSALVLLYWSIGSRIRSEVLKEKRAEYGKEILATLSHELTTHYGKGYTYDKLTRMSFSKRHPMRVLVVSHHALPHVGGLENLLDLELRGLAAAGHEVVLLTSDLGGVGQEPAYPPSVRTIRVRAWHGLERRFGIPYPVFSPALFPLLWKWIGWADVVHAHGFMFMNTALTIALARVRGKPSILTDHGGIQKFTSRAVTALARMGAESVGRVSSLLAGRVVVYNSRVGSQLGRLGRRGDIEFLPNPVDRGLFYPPTEADRAEARRQLGWDVGRPKVLFVGRLIPTKGIPLLLASVAAEYDLVFCGPGDPAVLGTLPRRGVEYLPPRPQSELVRLYHAADVLALPAEVREGFPLVVQEALACGLRVVLGYDPGFEPYRGLAGLVFCDRTPLAVTTALRAALAADRPGSSNPKGDFWLPLNDWIRRLYRLPASDRVVA